MWSQSYPRRPRRRHGCGDISVMPLRARNRFLPCDLGQLDPTAGGDGNRRQAVYRDPLHGLTGGDSAYRLLGRSRGGDAGSVHFPGRSGGRGRDYGGSEDGGKQVDGLEIGAVRRVHGGTPDCGGNDDDNGCLEPFISR